MVLEFKNGLMVPDMKVSGKIMKLTGKESSIIAKGTFTMGIGRHI